MNEVEKKGFIVNTKYEIIDEEAKIHIFGRFEDNTSFEAITTAPAYFYIKEKNEVEAKKLLHLKIEKTKLKTMQEEAVVKIIAKNPKDIPKLRKLFEDNNIPCYEADIKYVRRYLIDKNILSTISIKGKSTKGEYTDHYFENPEIKPGDEKITTVPKIISFDIETNEHATKIYSISLYNEDVKKVLLVENEVSKKQKIKNAIQYENEKEVLLAFLKEIKNIDPDVIIGWHVIDFDLKVLSAKAKEYDIPFSLGRSAENSTVRLMESFFKDSSAQITGRVVLDGIQVLKSSFVKLDDYKLNTAAKHFLHDTKLIEGTQGKGELITEKYLERPQELVDYNLKDSKLVYDIFFVSKIYDLTIQRSMLTGLRLDEVKASIASFDSLYLRELKKQGYVAQSTRPVNDEEGKGGFVMNSKPGIYDQVLVLDFKSLYPSLMRTFNIDPLEYVGELEELKRKQEHNKKEKKEERINYEDKNKFIIAPNNAVFRNNEKGILPKMLAYLWDQREQAKKEKNELARYAIKILMNSMYGVLASRNSRFHIRKLSNAITYFAEYFIKLTQEKVREKGFEVIYGDTDSVFVNVKTTDNEKAKKIGTEIETNINTFFTKHIKEKYSRKSILEIEFEKQYTKFFMPSVRGQSEKGAKKRYAGKKLYVDEDGKEKTKMDFTGLEFVRRDWTQLAKKFQLTLLDLLFENKSVEEFIKTFVEDFKKGKYDDLIIYRKALRKDVSEYTKTTPPHVKAARLLGDNVKQGVISYVITRKGPQPLEKLTSPIDYNHYIDKQIKPIANSVLELLKTNFDDVIKGSKQEGLGSFF